VTAGDLYVVGAGAVAAALEGREREVLDTVRAAYAMHARGETELPHSTFLRFPDHPANRIIALPAYLGDGVQTAGIKWIASAPGNIRRGMERASAVIVLNHPDTGRPWALLEGAHISAARTAASAALAAEVLHGDRDAEPIGLIGCGRINAEIVRFLRAVFPAARRFRAFDLDADRARGFAAQLGRRHPEVAVEVAGGLGEVLAGCPLVSFATTAVEPYLEDLGSCPPAATILHVSLRDLSPEAILAADNVVDDADHVSRAQTPIHLAEQRRGDRGFIRCSLGEVLLGTAAPRSPGPQPTVFSPFGLGILDIALARRVCEVARERGLGASIDGFLPQQQVEATA
jgi:ornithine cyclodeaminase